MIHSYAISTHPNTHVNKRIFRMMRENGTSQITSLTLYLLEDCRSQRGIVEAFRRKTERKYCIVWFNVLEKRQVLLHEI